MNRCDFLAGAWGLAKGRHSAVGTSSAVGNCSAVGNAVTRDHARKRAIRARMAATGEPYSVAARRTDGGHDTVPGEDAAPGDAAAAVAGYAARTLAAASARLEYRLDWEFTRAANQPPRSPGPLGRLARRAGRAAWNAFSPDLDLAELGATFAHQLSVGYLEPAAGRYLMNSAAYAQMRVGGQDYGGLPGVPLERRNLQAPPRAGEQRTDPLSMLGQLAGLTWPEAGTRAGRRARTRTGAGTQAGAAIADARNAGPQTLRGTACRVVTARAGTTALTVWLDDEHVRRVRAAHRASGDPASSGIVRVLELWDFGVPVGSLDWSRLPRFPVTAASPASGR